MTARPRRRGRARSHAGAARRSPPSDLARDDVLARILATVDSIPRGQVASYGHVALEAGLPGRARLVGRALGGLSGGSALAWHRVVNARGTISVRGGGAPAEQRRRLRAEGVRFDAQGRIDLERFGWRP